MLSPNKAILIDRMSEESPPVKSILRNKTKMTEDNNFLVIPSIQPKNEKKKLANN